LKREIVSILAALCGLVLLALSYTWPQVVGRQAVWSDDDQKEYIAAANEVHRLGVHRPPQDRAGRDEPGHAAKLEAAKQRFDQQKSRLEAARGGRQRNERVLFWLGLLLAIGGVVGTQIK
jgi:hypothetical protein